MGRIRRGGYIFLWWIGDHAPRHVHVLDRDERLISRVNLDTLEPMDTPTVSKKIIEAIRQLQKEGVL